MPLSPGERLGPYEILSLIGEGGMGEVYKARDTRLDRVVAVKVSKTAFDQRFEIEARAVASLNHPNVCTLHDVGPNYIVLEFVEGQELRGPIGGRNGPTRFAMPTGCCSSIDIFWLIACCAKPITLFPRR